MAKKFIVITGIVLVLVFVFLFVGSGKEAENITWGVNFSQKQATYLNLDWQEVYLALLEDLNVKNLRIAAHWNLLEPADQQFSFEGLDWQMDKAASYGAKVLLAVGMKTPRWPECHIPEWAEKLPKEELRAQVLEMLKAVVLRYKEHEALFAWQVENEPLLPFGECPFRDFSFLQDEVELVQSLDAEHEVLTSDSGEMSLWFNMARLGDKVAVTLYQKVWSEELNTYLSLPLPSVFYARKAWLVKQLFGKEVVVGELQAEPWVQGELENSTFQEQEKTMTLTQLQENIAFAKSTGLDTFYLWGGEWWYFMKETHNREEFWQEVKNIF
ncbi:beta-galactosidase [Patescibacteria group bacterium]|nr:beta-galactosidase [Patescibacteria group bacterium]